MQDDLAYRHHRNLREVTDSTGYKHEFLQLFGFDRVDVDYEQDVEADRRFDCLEL